ncbi:MAG: TetR family transcriptional regulator, partial [Kiritimatiellae bacterium]|nr:TetR family transcriptional regulator [Kiritimatiellia bacterium]
MKLDPTKLKDWQIAEAAEETMQPISDIATALGISKRTLYKHFDNKE